jgi:uncharacterized protein (TIRG00374 family)
MADNRKRSIWLKIIPGILISALAVYAVLQFINPKDLKNALSTVSWKFILVIIGTNLASLLIRGKAWQTILEKKIPFWEAFFGISEGYFLNNILPFRAGEFGRSFLVGRKSGLGTLYTLSSIVIERALDIGFAGILIVLTLPNLTGLDWMRPIAIIALILVVAGLAGLFLLSRLKEKVFLRLSKYEEKSRVHKIIIPLAKNLIEGFSTIKKPTQFLQVLFWIGLSWALWTFQYYFMLIQILPGQPFWTGAFICSVLALGIAIPSAPAALGVFEAAVTGAVVLLGGTSSGGFGYAVVVHLVHFIIVGILGMWGISRDQSSLSSLFNVIFRKNSTSTPAENT